MEDQDPADGSIASADRSRMRETGMSCYEFHHVVTIGDTNLLGGVYYTRVLEWMGQARERWLIACVAGIDQLLRDGLILITREVSCRFDKELHLGDPVVVRLGIPELGHCELRCIMTVTHAISGERHAIGSQRIVCAGADHRFRRWPPTLAEAAARIPGEWSSMDLQDVRRAPLEAVA